MSGGLYIGYSSVAIMAASVGLPYTLSPWMKLSLDRRRLRNKSEETKKAYNKQ